MASGTPIELSDRYLRERGSVYLSGIHALVRMPIDQHRRDARAGLRIGTLISGYPGSPLAGYDLQLQRARAVLDRHDIRHRPGQNEELAATSLIGTQMLDRYPHSRYDGVLGIWYGKGPGVDRSGDALKHGNFAGTSRHGAVVLLSGEDHEAKSSTMPYQDDYAFVSAGIPILYPATIADLLELGAHAVGISRYSGCWVALKLASALCDGGATLEVDAYRPAVIEPELEIDGRPFHKRTDFGFFPGTTIDMERHLHYERHPAVRAYARANGVDRAITRSARDRLGIIASGKSFSDTAQALRDMGLDDDVLAANGVRMLQPRLIYPIDETAVRDFAQGLDLVIVIEEKRPFVEQQVRDALYGTPGAPRVIGKLDERGETLFPIQGGLDADAIAERLGPRLVERGLSGAVAARLEEIRRVRARRYAPYALRMPNYCSGCPHNTSTVLADGQVAWGSPGCHSFAEVMEQPERRIEAMTQLGGEGLPWLGLAPFTDKPHMIQNVGDGSFFHSSHQNVRFAVAAGVDLTFKLLYNGAVANTGGQAPVGGVSVPEVTRLLELDGVTRTAIVTKEPKRYARARLAANTTVHPASDLTRVETELEHVRGVTVLIYDDDCANERRRQEKRGTRPRPTRFVAINPEVCEACGHCGQLTNCMSLQKIETELGPKTFIHQSSCDHDRSCVNGDCPSFMVVEVEPGSALARPATPSLGADALPEPAAPARLDRPYHIHMPGVGGTGMITLNALLCHAALIDGVHAVSYDQTGAAQKWGAVVSSCVISAVDLREPPGRVTLGRADLYLVCDLLGGVAPLNLDRCDPGRTAAVVNTTFFPTAGSILDPFYSAPTRPMLSAIRGATRTATELEARRIAETLFGDHMMTNLVLLGAAYQSGLVPLSAASIERAIALNDVQVEMNVQAFRYGRLAVHDPTAVALLVSPRGRTADEERAARRTASSDPAAYERLLDRAGSLDEGSRRLLAVRVAELIAYQDARYAAAFVDLVLRVAERERSVVDGEPRITHAVIRQLYKLMAYKDEYEVARLHLKEDARAWVRGQFARPTSVRYLLHPPLLRALGLRHKIELGAWADPLLGLLRAMRRLRGTPFDPFGHTRVRREERRLVGWYREAVERGLGVLAPDSYERVLAIASVPDGIRGYEEIKLRSIDAATARMSELLTGLS
ncbi:MAG: indolepyruvate ferredoxin oxidoreductase family protein [Chloroflexota bacterium]|nr:indolepyruvate ferredoxin oxidoreductase family protein [Chloroflexota bacterium]MDE3192428.1 indolepyruvate ferredoxin oxidoreductase family protein [Chloroflexota bacterium]